MWTDATDAYAAGLVAATAPLGGGARLDAKEARLAASAAAGNLDVAAARRQ